MDSQEMINRFEANAKYKEKYLEGVTNIIEQRTFASMNDIFEYLYELANGPDIAESARQSATFTYSLKCFLDAIVYCCKVGGLNDMGKPNIPEVTCIKHIKDGKVDFIFIPEAKLT